MPAISENPAAAFDAASASYDAVFSALPAVRSLRKRVFRLFLARLPERARILDFGCGTGEDVLALAGLGHTVVGCDSSEGMLAVAAAKLRDGPANAAFLRALNLRPIRNDSFDVVLSNFGALNCTEDPEGTIRECHRILRSGGLLAVVLIGKYCVWETFSFLARGRLHSAFRRWRRRTVVAPVEGTGVTLRFFSHRQFRRLVRRRFEILAVAGLNVITPPPRSSLVRGAAAGLWSRLESVEEILQRVPPARSLGDHIVFIMRKRISVNLGHGVDSKGNS